MHWPNVFGTLFPVWKEQSATCMLENSGTSLSRKGVHGRPYVSSVPTAYHVSQILDEGLLKTDTQLRCVPQWPRTRPRARSMVPGDMCPQCEALDGVRELLINGQVILSWISPDITDEVWRSKASNNETGPRGL